MWILSHWDVCGRGEVVQVVQVVRVVHVADMDRETPTFQHRGVQRRLVCAQIIKE